MKKITLENFKKDLYENFEIGGVDLDAEIQRVKDWRKTLGEENTNELLQFLDEEKNRPRFRSSSIGNLFTDPKLKRDKEAGNLSDTVQSMIEEIWLSKNYGVRGLMEVKETIKGKLCEVDAIDLVQQLDESKKEFRVKNSTRLYSKWSSGECDLVLSDSIEDIKIAYDINSFFKKGKKDAYKAPDGKIHKGFTKTYYGQAQDYMRLWNKKKFTLIYVAINTPEELLIEEEKRYYFKYNCDEENKDYIKASKQIRANHDFLKIPLEKRIKKFTIERDDEFLKKLDGRAANALKHYENIEL